MLENILQQSPDRLRNEVLSEQMQTENMLKVMLIKNSHKILLKI